MSTRAFRTPESLKEEAVSRDAVRPFLEGIGFSNLKDERQVAGTATEQIVSATTETGDRLKLRIRLCWRRGGRNKNEHLYSAAQLRARLIDDSWDATLRHIVSRDRDVGVTHNLFLQRDGEVFIFAALVPVDALFPIWAKQAEVSDELRASGLIRPKGKNHARNGHSPTIWLQDDREAEAHRVADVLWQWPGVLRLEEGIKASSTGDDSYDDCPSPDFSLLGSDGAPKRLAVRSEVKRDRRVRQAVLDRATGCERPGCDASRAFTGFLDVHHILGAEKGDRVWNCVALCPNCHREAHFAPNADALNAELLKVAGALR